MLDARAVAVLGGEERSSLQGVRGELQYLCEESRADQKAPSCSPAASSTLKRALLTGVCSERDDTWHAIAS